MPIGPIIRRALGPLEPVVSDLYRRAFFDMSPFIADIARRAAPLRVLEIGTGEGAVLSALSTAWPQAELVGIDIVPTVGRLYSGDRSRATFIQSTAKTEAARSSRTYDVVLLCDVLHHVPEAERRELLSTVRELLRPGGTFVFKDWERRTSISHAMNVFSDRFVTGDRNARYLTEADARVLLEAVFRQEPTPTQRWGPWPSNFSMTLTLA